MNALTDTGSSDSFICEKLVQEFNLMIISLQYSMCIAESSETIKLLVYVTADIQINNISYPKTIFYILENLCTDVITGQEILSYGKNLTVNFSRDKTSLSICRLFTMKSEPPLLFTNSKPDCKPIAVKSCHYSQSNRKFTEIRNLQNPAIIERNHH